MKKLAFLLAALPAALVQAADSISPAQWEAAAPHLQAALECRQRINRAHPALRPLLPRNRSGLWELTPPTPLTVFGLPVSRISIYIDPSGEMGASYTAFMAGQTIASLAKAATLKGDPSEPGRKTRVGMLTAGQAYGPATAEFTCTVMGTWQPDD